MPIRNPFARRPGLMIPHEESIGSDSSSSLSAADPAHPGFERVDTVGSKASSALSVRSRRSQDTGEYKMSGMIAFPPPAFPSCLVPPFPPLLVLLLPRPRLYSFQRRLGSRPGNGWGGRKVVTRCTLTNGFFFRALQWSMTAVFTCRYEIFTLFSFLGAGE